MTTEQKYCVWCDMPGHMAKDCPAPKPAQPWWGRKLPTALLACAMLSTPAMALNVEGHTITLSDKEAVNCENEGGCMVRTKKAFQQAMQMAYDAGKKAAMHERTI